VIVGKVPARAIFEGEGDGPFPLLSGQSVGICRVVLLFATHRRLENRALIPAIGEHTPVLALHLNLGGDAEIVLRGLSHIEEHLLSDGDSAVVGFPALVEVVDSPGELFECDSVFD